MTPSNPEVYVSLAVAVAAAVDDVMTRRVHHWLLLVMAVFSLAAVFLFHPYGLAAGLETAAGGFLTGLAIYFPLAWLGIVGGGDLKLLAILGLSTGAWAILTIGCLALGWASVMGVLQVIFQGQIKGLVRNMASMARLQKPEAARLHKIPFAAAIFLATATQMTLNGRGGFL